MRIVVTIVVAFAAVSIAAAAWLSFSAGGRPPLLVQRIQRDLTDAGEQPASADQLKAMLSVVNVETDHSRNWRPDYRADWNRLGLSRWCGTGGCRNQVFVARRRDGGYDRAFDAQVNDLAVTRGQVDADLHGVHCGKTGPEPCRRSFRWDSFRHALYEVPNRQGETILTGPLFQPVSLTPDMVDAEVKAAADHLGAECKAIGIGVSPTSASGMDLISSIPDINDDGRRDWIVEGEKVYCDKGDDIPAVSPRSKVFITRGRGVTLALERARFTYEIDVRSKPARLVLVMAGESCEGRGQPRCPRRIFGWNPEHTLLKLP